MWLDDEHFQWSDAIDEDEDAIETANLKTAQAAAHARPCDDIRSFAANGSHNACDGPPFLRCSAPMGLVLLSHVDTPCDSKLLESELSVWVEWSENMERGSEAEYSLILRLQGRQVAESKAAAGEPLRVAAGYGDAVPGETFVAELRWSDGVRWLHPVVPLPPTRRLNLGGLLLLPPAIPPADQSALPPLPATLPARGFGIELELLVPVPDGSGGTSSKQHLATTLQALEKAASEAGDAQVAAALARCALWQATTDGDIGPTFPAVASRMVEHAAVAVGEAIDQLTRSRWLALLTCAPGAATRAEFKSPPPPNELRWSNGAALEIDAFVRRGLGALGAAASSITAAGRAGTALHVHVNVCSAAAAGPLLTAAQICRVFLWWVRFDAVTMRFARPWCWREHYSAPMHATGAEPAEPAWDASPTVESLMADAARNGAGACARRLRGHVPALVRAIHAATRGAEWASLAEEARVERLLDAAGDRGTGIGRYLSLNLYSLRAHGTLEFRRFHGTVDAALITRWAHFCVAFVEAFAAAPWPALEQAPTADAALDELQRAQEVATTAELMERMGGHIDPTMADYFLRDSLGEE